MVHCRKPLETVIQQATIVDHGPLRATVEASRNVHALRVFKLQL